jgi:hypothetical protein
MNQHHKDGFSQWPSILQCCGFQNNGKSSKESDEGTKIHGDAETAYSGGFCALTETADWAVQWLRENENAMLWVVEQ